MQCKSGHIMLFGSSIQESFWTCLIYECKRHQWPFAVLNLRKKNLCCLLPFGLWHSQVTLQNPGWSYSVLPSRKNLWYVGPHMGLTGVHCLENGVAPGRALLSRERQRQALLVSSYNQNCSKDDVRCHQCLQITQRASSCCCHSKDVYSFMIWLDRVGEREDTFEWSYKYSTYSKMQYQMASSKWNAGWFYEIPKLLNIGFFVYALYNQNLLEDSLRNTFTRIDTAICSPSFHSVHRRT